MPTLKSLEDQGRALFAKQTEVVTDDRPWSEKRAEYDAIQKDIDAVFEQHTALKGIDKNPFEKIGDDAPGADVASNAKTYSTYGDYVTKASEYAEAVKFKGSQFSKTIEIDTKATLTQAAGGAGTVVPQYLPGVVPFLFRRLTVADLIPQGVMNSQAIIYRVMSAITNAAATVAEGGAKPQSDATWTQVTETARKIATTAKISDEMIQDADYVASEVNQLLVQLVEQAEEDQLLNGNGTAPNLRGILNRSGLTAAQAVGSDTRVDALFKEIVKIRNAFIEPDAIVLNPTDWQSIRLLKDDNGQYYGGGPFGWGPYGNGQFAGGNATTSLTGGSETLWGVRVVVTPAMTQGTALVGGFSRAAQIFRRTGLTVEMTNSNEDDFLHNLIAVRAEERLALAVKYPAGFGTVTGL